MVSDGGADGPGQEAAAFREFAGRLTAGEDVATRLLLERYSARLVAVARSRLGARLRTKADPEDVFQSVLRTFFRRLGSGEVELRDWSNLSGLLSLITIRKCQTHAARFAAARRDPRREASLFLGGDGRLPVAIPDREPTPYEVAAFVDLLAVLVERLDESDREVLRGLIAGETVAETADRLRCSERTVYRALAKIRQGLLERGGRGD